MEPSTEPINPIEPIKPKKSKALITATIVCAILAVAGIAFGAYEMMDINQKSQQISELKVNVEDKNAKIAELETIISSLITENKNAEIAETAEPKTEENDADTATITLGDIIDENETRTVFKIGQCTADGPSVKCPITTPNGEALISFLTTDKILRLSLPND